MSCIPFVHIFLSYLETNCYFLKRFVLDSADPHNISASKRELHALCEIEALYDIPVLILANKNDLPEAITLSEVESKLDTSAIRNHQVTCYSISVKEGNNMDAVLGWLLDSRWDKPKKPEHNGS